MRADVIIIGLGSMGAAAARELAARGVKVLGLDRFAPPHDRGAHAGGSRIIRMAYMEGPFYVPLVRAAYARWRELEERTGTTLLRPTGGLMMGSPETVAFGGALATARTYDLPHELLDPAEIRRRFPAFAPADDEFGLYEEVAGLIRPEAAIAALLAEARQFGADLRTGVTVHDWTTASTPANSTSTEVAEGEGGGPPGVVVWTAGGDLYADRLILTPGAWAPDLVRLGVPMRVERRVQHYWRPTDPAAFERLPVWIWGSGERTGYGLPAVESGWVKAALHWGTGGEAVDPDSAMAPARPEEVAEIRDWITGRMPGLGDWMGAKPCLYTLTPDEHFVLGKHPAHPNVAVACGFSGHGFKFVPVIGEILADLVQDRPVGYDLSLFDPSRFGAHTIPA